MALEKEESNRGRAGSLATRRRRPRFRRESILTAATGLFREHGYEKTGMEHIGGAVGITGSALYRHFPNKQALLSAIVVRWGELFDRGVHEILAARLPAKATLEKLVEFSIQMALENRDLMVIVQREREHLPTEIRHDIAQKRRKLIDEWADLLCTARQRLSRNDARVIASAVHGTIVFMAEEEPPVSQSRMRELITRVALAALYA